jgi:hypothetical protein
MNADLGGGVGAQRFTTSAMDWLTWVFSLAAPPRMTAGLERRLLVSLSQNGQDPARLSGVGQFYVSGLHARALL